MTLSKEHEAEIERLVKVSLDDAEAVWDKFGNIFEGVETSNRTRIAKAEVVPSRIPDNPSISSDAPGVHEFVCLVADMRDASKHLLMAHAGDNPDMTQMKRVYFETAALLPALDITIRFSGGRVTEYLGDGVLALFQAGGDRDRVIKAAYRAAQNCVGGSLQIVNKCLYERYSLPSLKIGVGLSISHAIVQLVGVPGDSHPKAIGPCVYYATKLSGGQNQIFVHENLRMVWPKSKGGGLRFHKGKSRGIDGYLVVQSKSS